MDILDAINELNLQSSEPLYNCIGFLDDDKEKWGKEYYGVRVLGSIEKARNFTDTYFINGIGNDSNFMDKKSILDRSGISSENFISIIHPTASISKTASIGIGTVILQNVTIASGVSIGNHVLIMAHSVINHDVQVGDYTFVTSGVCISGGVKVGEGCYIGTNSSIIGKIQIGENSLIGMGSVVLDTIPSHCVYVGNPAKFLKNL